jgi:hypothetical protein
MNEPTIRRIIEMVNPQYTDSYLTLRYVSETMKTYVLYDLGILL